MGGRVEELEQRYDGRIPADLLAWAKVEDARAAFERRQAEALTGPGSQVGRIRYKAEAIRADMARAMRLIEGREGSCERHHLIGAGFTPSEIALHAEAASRLASIESDKPQGDIFDQMVAAIVDIASRDGSCTEIEILRCGFARADLDQLGEAACALATIRMARRGEC